MLEIPKEHGGFRSFAFSPDMKSVAGGTGAGKMSSDGGKEEIFGGHVIIWNATTGKIQRTLKGHDSTVSWVAYSNDGRILASASPENGMIKLWDAQTGATRHTLKVPGKIGTTRNGAELLCVLSSDGKLIAAVAKPSSDPGAGKEERAAGTLIVWDTGSGKVRWELPDSEFYALAVSPDASTLAVLRGNFEDKEVDGKQVKVAPEQVVVGLDAATGKDRWSIPIGRGLPQNLQYTPDGRLLASYNRRLRFIDPAAGAHGMKEVKLPGEGTLNTARLSPDGKRFAASRFMSDGIEWGDVTTGKITAAQAFREERFREVTFAPDLETAVGVLKFTPQILKLTAGPPPAPNARRK
jgi:WD40 repeat protein